MQRLLSVPCLRRGPKPELRVSWKRPFLVMCRLPKRRKDIRDRHHVLVLLVPLTAFPNAALRIAPAAALRLKLFGAGNIIEFACGALKKPLALRHSRCGCHCGKHALGAESADEGEVTTEPNA